MKVVALPSCAAISLMPFLKTRCRSAVTRASSQTTFTSCWPRPASPLEVSTGIPAAHISLRMRRRTYSSRRRLQQLVVLNGGGVRRQVLPSLGVRLLVGLLEEEELELGGAADPQAALGRPLQLPSQNPSGRHLDRRPVLVGQVADDEGRAGLPGDQPGGVVVGMAHEVAVAGVPVGEAVAGQRVHVDVDGQQVVARLHAVLGRVGREEVRRHPLAHRATVHVGEGQHDGVDRPVGDSGVNELTSRSGHAPC